MQGLCCITDSSYTLLPSMLQVQRAFSRTLVAPVYKTFLGFPPPNPRSTHQNRKIFKSYRRSTSRISALSSRVVCGILPVDPWAPNVDSQSIASQLFAVSLFPYLGFLYFITKSKTAPKVTLFGFYFLLAFVGATIPAGIYAKVHYGTSLSNVDWLHGGAESLLTLTNLFIVLGLREALRKKNHAKENMPEVVSEIKDEKKLPPRLEVSLIQVDRHQRSSTLSTSIVQAVPDRLKLLWVFTINRVVPLQFNSFYF